MALLYDRVCPYPTEPLAGSLDQPHPTPDPTPPCMSDTGAMMAHQPPKDSVATQKICLLGDEGSGRVVSERFLFQKADFVLDVSRLQKVSSLLRDESVRQDPLM